MDEIRYGLVDVGQKILNIADADDGIDVFAVDREAGEAVFHRKYGGLCNAGILIDGADVRTVCHDLGDGGVVEIENVRDHVALIFFDNAFFLAFADHVEDFFFGDGFIKRFGVVAQKTHETVRNEVAQEDKRMHDGAEGAQHGAEFVCMLHAVCSLVRYEFFRSEVCCR